jgi:type I restriction enzyme M protein
MIETAFPKSGRMGVIVPHGVLFRGGNEGKIRKSLIEENLLDAVVGLPENLFFGTGIPAAILLFDRRREGGGKLADRKDVLFINASAEFTTAKNQNTLDDGQIDKIVRTLRERKVINRFSALASAQQILENDYNLNIPRYVESFAEEPLVDIPTAQREIEMLETELAQVRARLNAYLSELT